MRKAKAAVAVMEAGEEVEELVVKPRRKEEVAKPLVVPKKEAQEALYMIVDSTLRVVVYEFRVASDSDFETKVATFLAAYCARTGSKVEAMMILTPVREALFDSIRESAEVAVHACRESTTIKLTRREIELGEWLVREVGISNKEVASKMNLSERTVKFHISSLLQKFGVDNRTLLGEALRKHMPHVAAEANQ